MSGLNQNLNFNHGLPASSDSDFRAHSSASLSSPLPSSLPSLSVSPTSSTSLSPLPANTNTNMSNISNSNCNSISSTTLANLPAGAATTLANLPAGAAAIPLLERMLDQNQRQAEQSQRMLEQNQYLMLQYQQQQEVSQQFQMQLLAAIKEANVGGARNLNHNALCSAGGSSNSSGSGNANANGAVHSRALISDGTRSGTGRCGENDGGNTTEGETDARTRNEKKDKKEKKKKKKEKKEKAQEEESVREDEEAKKAKKEKKEKKKRKKADKPKEDKEVERSGVAASASDRSKTTNSDSGAAHDTGHVHDVNDATVNPYSKFNSEIVPCGVVARILKDIDGLSKADARAATDRLPAEERQLYLDYYHAMRNREESWCEGFYRKIEALSLGERKEAVQKLGENDRKVYTNWYSRFRRSERKNESRDASGQPSGESFVSDFEQNPEGEEILNTGGNAEESWCDESDESWCLEFFRKIDVMNSRDRQFEMGRLAPDRRHLFKAWRERYMNERQARSRHHKTSSAGEDESWCLQFLENIKGMTKREKTKAIEKLSAKDRKFYCDWSSRRANPASAEFDSTAARDRIIDEAGDEAWCLEFLSKTKRMDMRQKGKAMAKLNPKRRKLYLDWYSRYNNSEKIEADMAKASGKSTKGKGRQNAGSGGDSGGSGKGGKGKGRNGKASRNHSLDANRRGLGSNDQQYGYDEREENHNASDYVNEYRFERKSMRSGIKRERDDAGDGYSWADSHADRGHHQEDNDARDWEGRSAKKRKTNF